jgi:hypothetical protein
VAEVGSSGYLDNLSSISMIYEGKVLKDLIPRIYDRPGRVVPAMGADEQRRNLMVNIPFTQNGGQPQAVPPGTPGAEVLDLKAGELSVTAVVGKSYATRREETSEAIGAIMQAAPALAPILAPFWLDELDFPGAKKLAAIAKKTLPPQFQEEQANQQQALAQLQQQMAQAQQVMDLMAKELEKKTEIIETDRVKADAQVQITQLELASKERIESLKAQVELLKAEIAAGSKADATLATREGGTERVLYGSVAKSVQQLDQHAHERDLAAQQEQMQRDLAQQASEAQERQAAMAQQAGPQGPGPGGA